jgi:hypothetical protein
MYVHLIHYKSSFYTYFTHCDDDEDDGDDDEKKIKLHFFK